MQLIHDNKEKLFTFLIEIQNLLKYFLIVLEEIDIL